MKDYYPNSCPLPQDVYNQALWFVRGYDRMVAEADDLVSMGAPADGLPRGTKVSDPVHAAAVRRERLTKQIRIIEEALDRLPPEYRKTVFENVAHRTPLKELSEAFYADRSTWSRHRMAFLRDIAEHLGYEPWHQM